MEDIQTRVRENLYRFFVNDFHIRPSDLPQDLFDERDRRLRSYVWVFRDIFFEGGFGACTLEYFERILVENPVISEEAFQILMRDYFLVSLNRLYVRGYFEPVDAATAEILRSTFTLYLYPRVRYLLERSRDYDFLYRELRDTYLTHFFIFNKASFKEKVSKKRLGDTIEEYYRAKQHHLKNVYYPHKVLLYSLVNDPDVYDDMEREVTSIANFNAEEVGRFVNRLAFQ